MLARASSDAGTRLRRSKSASVVHRPCPPVIESLDPDIAHQHAIAAATAAFARSQTQQSTERNGDRSIGLRRTKSTTSRKSLTSQGSHFPPRGLSVRSVPPPKSTQISSLDGPPTASASRAERVSSFQPTPISQRPLSSPVPVSAQSSLASSDHARPGSQAKSHRGIASSITSQQIRKARSMYYASSVQTGSPIARPPAKYLTTPPSFDASPAMVAAPKAYIPTRGTGPSPLAVPRVPVPVAPGETIDNARDRYLQDFQRQTVKHKPSIFLAPFKKRQDRSKNKIERPVSAVTPAAATTFQFMDDTVVDITVNDFMPQSDPKDKRSFSGSLKKTIRRVFRRTSKQSPNLPVQQIEASRDYFTDAVDLTRNDHADIPSPDEKLLQRVRSRTPSSMERGCSQTRRSASRSSSKESAPSNRSLHIDANVSQPTTSRVTSWNTSASGETLTQRAMKRLTVIHESKDSMGSLVERSASTSTKRKSLHLPTFSAFNDPMHMESLAEEASTPAVDPKRVFSALKREIDATNSSVALPIHNEPELNPVTNPGTEDDIFESGEAKNLHLTMRDLLTSASKDSEMHRTNEPPVLPYRPGSVAARSTQSKKNSIKTFGQAMKSTIRKVTPGESPSSPCPDGLAGLQTDKRTPSTDASSKSPSDNEGRATMFRKLHFPKKR